MSNITLFISYFYFIFFSVFGSGIFFCRIVKISLTKVSFGIVGIIGIFFLTFISYLTNFFFSHNFIHNLIILIPGLLFISYQFLKFKTFLKKKFINCFLISLLFIIGLFLSKNNEDFGYYHFAYISNLTESKIQFGLANFNSGFGTQSSIFYFSSLLYLPFVNYFLVNSHSLLILIFANFFFLDNFFFKRRNYHNFIKILSLFSFVFVNLFFWRIAEYGTDRAGQIVVFIIIIIFLSNLIKKSYSDDNIKILLILVCYVLSFKSYFLIYFFLVPLIYKNYSNSLNIFFQQNLNLLILLSVFLFSYFAVNIANTGCIVYPLSFTCFYSFFWSVSSETVIALNKWFELWSKAGATPNFTVDNPGEYLQNFNWVFNWINKYFFTKMSDTLAGLILIIIVFLFLFRSNHSKKKKLFSKFIHLYLLLIIFFIVWFNKHPDLRYGGYALISLLFFIPFSAYLAKYNNVVYNFNNFRVFLLVVLVLLSFNVRNYLRIVSEFNRNDLYIFDNFPFFSEEYLKTNIKFNLIKDPMIISGYNFYTNK